MDVMNKAQLRAACKEAGIKGYGKMTNQQMREAIADAAKQEQALEALKLLVEGAAPEPEVVEPEVVEDAAGEVTAQDDHNEGDSTARFNPFGSLVKQVCEPTTRVVKKGGSNAGIKIEKNREERNGIRRPSAGGLCRAVWDMLDEEVAAGREVSVRRAKEIAAERGWNVNNASIEYYLWKKFNKAEV